MLISKVFQTLCNLQGVFLVNSRGGREAEKPNPPHAKVNLNVLDWVGKVRQLRRSMVCHTINTKNNATGLNEVLGIIQSQREIIQKEGY